MFYVIGDSACICSYLKVDYGASFAKVACNDGQCFKFCGWNWTLKWPNTICLRWNCRWAMMNSNIMDICGICITVLKHHKRFTIFWGKVELLVETLVILVKVVTGCVLGHYVSAELCFDVILNCYHLILFVIPSHLSLLSTCFTSSLEPASYITQNSSS